MPKGTVYISFKGTQEDEQNLRALGFNIAKNIKGTEKAITLQYKSYATRDAAIAKFEANHFSANDLQTTVHRKGKLSSLEERGFNEVSLLRDRSDAKGESQMLPASKNYNLDVLEGRLPEPELERSSAPRQTIHPSQTGKFLRDMKEKIGNALGISMEDVKIAVTYK